MDDKKCPRCGEDMEYNAIVMDYVCNNCQYLSMEAMERMTDEWNMLRAVDAQRDSKHSGRHLLDQELWD